MGKRWGAFMVCAALCATLSATPANAAFPGTNGKILYIAPGPNASQNLASLRTINPDGTGVDTVTDSATGVAAWSPSGTRIAFECAGTLCAINADGSNYEYWYDNGCCLAGWLDWSPDESKVVVIEPQDEFGHTYLTVLDTGPDPGGMCCIREDVGGAPWSPDGTRIAIVDWSQPVIQTIAPDGTGTTTVPNTETATGRLDWSPTHNDLSSRERRMASKGYSRSSSTAPT